MHFRRNQKGDESRKSKSRGELENEADGSRTRNHRIDSPVL